MLTAVAALSVAFVGLTYAADDTPEAAKARKLLDTKMKNVKFKDTPLKDALEEIQDEVKGLTFILDTKGGVSRNQKVSFEGKDVPVTEVLDGLFKKNGLGYYVISKKGDAYNGSVFVKQGAERGYPKGEEPKKDK